MKLVSNSVYLSSIYFTIEVKSLLLYILVANYAAIIVEKEEKAAFEI